MQIITSDIMKELDRQAIQTVGIPGMVLMENAGRGTVDLMEKHFGLVQGKKVILFVGPGNNGGDGLVIARTVYNRGGEPYLLLLSDPERLQGDAAHNYQIVQKSGVHCKVIVSREQVAQEKEYLNTLCQTKTIHSMVDSIFGIGLDRAVEGHFAAVIECIHELATRYGIAITSADIPSGMNSDTGKIMGASVSPDLTVTYGFVKPAHFHHGGSNIGHLETVDIGIPPNVLDTQTIPHISALTPASCPTYKKKDITSHKGTNGHVAIIAGSEGKTGAAILSAKGAIHANAGLVTLLAPEKLNQIYEITLAEAMSVVLPYSSTAIGIDDYQHIQHVLSTKNSIVLGPGLGNESKTADLVLALYQDVSLPMVVDADALTILAENKNILSRPGGPRIITPHPGEMARLINASVESVQADRVEAATTCNQQCSTTSHEVVTVLKGAGTIVLSTKNRWCINTTGNPGMGAGGMGDVLSGIIASFLAQGYSLWESACLGVFSHGLSADILSQKTPHGYVATEVAQNLPCALQTIQTYQKQNFK